MQFSNCIRRDDQQRVVQSVGDIAVAKDGSLPFKPGATIPVVEDC